MNSLDLSSLASFSFLPDLDRPIESYFPLCIPNTPKSPPRASPSPAPSSSSSCFVVFNQQEDYGPPPPPQDDGTRAREGTGEFKGKGRAIEAEEADDGEEDWFSNRFKRRRTLVSERAHSSTKEASGLPEERATGEKGKRQPLFLPASSSGVFPSKPPEPPPSLLSGSTASRVRRGGNGHANGGSMLGRQRAYVGGFEDSADGSYAPRAPLPPSRPRQRCSSPPSRQRAFSPPSRRRSASPPPRRRPAPYLQHPPSPRRRTPSPAPDRHNRPPSTTPYYHTNRLSVRIGTFQKGLLHSDYAPFLLPSRPVHPLFSVNYSATVLRFLDALAPRQLWSARPNAGTFATPVFDPLIKRVMEFQPDRERLRREYPLGEVEFPPSALKGKEQTKWVKLRDVVRWIWEEERDEVGWDNVAFAVQELPHPLVALLRQWADNSRFRLATNHAWQDCAAYLRNATASHYTPRERRARILLRWLDEGKEVRQNAFSCDAEGRVLPGDEAWEWWLDEMEGAATTQDLEKRVRRRSEEKR